MDVRKIKIMKLLQVIALEKDRIADLESVLPVLCQRMAEVSVVDLSSSHR